MLFRSLFFLGLQHPNPNVPPMRMATELRRLAEELGLVGTHVFFNEGWVAYETRADFLLEADVGVSTHLDHVETAYSFRSRILDYLWAGLPIVATAGDAFADLIEAERLGAAVPPGDDVALEAALWQVLGEGGTAGACRLNVARVAPNYVWEQALAPLLAFCRDPRPAPDLVLTDPARPSFPAQAHVARRLMIDAYREGPRRALRQAAGLVRRAL